VNRFFEQLYGLAERAVIALEMIARAQRDSAIALGVLAQRRQRKRDVTGLEVRGG
jgi:hypothetical protein